MTKAKKDIDGAWDGKFIPRYDFDNPSSKDPCDLADEVLDRVPAEETVFHIGQCYEFKPADTLKCKRCGGLEFNVGKASCFTAIKCIKCLWELCVHEG